MKETLKIRHYVMGLMHQAGSSSVQLMSSRELAAHFGMARSTVSLALKELIDDGYIYSRKGIGNFTNPHNLAVPRVGSVPRLVGLLLHDGRHFFMNRNTWRHFSAMAEAITEAGYHLRIVMLTAGEEDAILDEIRDNHLDGLIWFNSSDLPVTRCNRLQELKLPVVSDHSEADRVNVVTGDYDSAVTQIARKLVESGERNILLCYDGGHVGRAYRRIFPQHLKSGELTIMPPTDFAGGEELKAYLAAHPDALVFAHSHHTEYIRQIAAEAGVKIRILDTFMMPGCDRPARFFPDFRKLGTEAVARLTAIMQGDRDIRKQIIPMILTDIL